MRRVPLIFGIRVARLILSLVFPSASWEGCLHRADADLSAQALRSSIYTGTILGVCRRTISLGFIANNVYQDLCVIREIRNRFAHSSDELDFNDEEIKLAVLSFVTV